MKTSIALLAIIATINAHAADTSLVEGVKTSCQVIPTTVVKAEDGSVGKLAQEGQKIEMAYEDNNSVQSASFGDYKVRVELNVADAKEDSDGELSIITELYRGDDVLSSGRTAIPLSEPNKELKAGTDINIALGLSSVAKAGHQGKKLSQMLEEKIIAENDIISFRVNCHSEAAAVAKEEVKAEEGKGEEVKQEEASSEESKEEVSSDDQPSDDQETVQEEESGTKERAVIEDDAASESDKRGSKSK